MRRVLSGPAAYAAELAGTIGRGWNRFFFEPADPTPLGLIRVAVGLLLIWSLGVYGLDLRDFLGSDGWADPEAIRQWMRARTPWAWSFWLLVPDQWLGPTWALCLVVLVLYTVGLGSRLTAVLAWTIAVSTSRRVPVGQFGFDQVVGTLALYLAASGASGQSVSLDRFLKRWRLARSAIVRRRPGSQPAGLGSIPPGVPEPAVSARLGLRLIQLHLALVYGAAGLAKLQGGAWWNGFAAWGIVSAAEFRNVDLTPLAAHPLLLNLMTHGGLAIELSYPILVWVPALRPLLLAVVVLMHAGVALTLGLTEFGLAMAAGNLAFVSGPWLRSLVTGRSSSPSGRVLYDGGCPRCRASMALLVAADPGRVVDPVDLTAVDVAVVHPSLTRSACLEAMHLVHADGRVDVGYDALARLARWLPLGWPLGAIGSLPGIAWAGRRAYRAVAAGRRRDVPCSDAVCGLHPVASATDRDHPSPADAPASARSGRPIP